jgi:DNA-binding response OmpR family regulator
MAVRCPSCGQLKPDLNGIVFDKASAEITRGGITVKFSRQEIDLVEYLFKKIGRVAKNYDITEWLYQLVPDCDRPENEYGIVKVRICKIRDRLSSIGLEIETIWGEGYRLNVVPMPAPAEEPAE